MEIRHARDVSPRLYGEGIEKRVLIGPQEGAPTFVMRRFDLPEGMSSPYHSHDWEHEVYVLSGSGVAVTEAGEVPVGPEDAIFVPGDEVHCFRNTGDSTFQFLCLVPLRGEDTP
jgi:quercetin dioxygenase-like cupin family protein